jgi:hypothetical protein
MKEKRVEAGDTVTISYARHVEGIYHKSRLHSSKGPPALTREAKPVSIAPYTTAWLTG